jgi:hypothetical protein
MPQLRYNKRNLELRAPSGDLAIADVSAGIDSHNYEQGVVDLRVSKLTLPNPADTVDFYVQVELDGTWVDVANIHLTAADTGTTPARLIGIGPKAAGVKVFTPTDGALPANTSQDVILGESVRIKVVVTLGANAVYAYEARLSLLG